MLRCVAVLLLSSALCAAAVSARADEEPAPPPDPAAVVEGLKSDEDAARLAAAEQSLDVTDDAVTKPLVRLLTDDRFEIRAAAVRALGARSTEKAKKEAAKALCSRIPKLSKSAVDEGELALVVQALHDLAQPSSIGPLLDDVEDSATEDLYRARVMAVANVPDAEAIEALINHLARRGRGKWGGMKKCVVEALRDATGEKLGADPDAWRAWWRDAKRTFDFEAAAQSRADAHREVEEREQRKRDRKDRRRKKDGDDSG